MQGIFSTTLGVSIYTGEEAATREVWVDVYFSKAKGGSTSFVCIDNIIVHNNTEKRDVIQTFLDGEPKHSQLIRKALQLDIVDLLVAHVQSPIV